MPRLSRETILSYFLAFVVLWFGSSEIMSPDRFVAYMPSFLGGSGMANSLVMVHGVLLVLSGLALVFNFHRRVAAFVIFLMIGGIVATLLSVSGLDEIAVRDIGLLGMALALAIRN